MGDRRVAQNLSASDIISLDLVVRLAEVIIRHQDPADERNGSDTQASYEQRSDGVVVCYRSVQLVSEVRTSDESVMIGGSPSILGPRRSNRAIKSWNIGCGHTFPTHVVLHVTFPNCRGDSRSNSSTQSGP